MRREGSAFQGLGVVTLKELADHLTSIRLFVLELLVMVIALVTVYLATEQIRETTAEDPFLFLKLFTTTREQSPFSFLFFLSFLVPLMAIGLGFDSVNSEYNQRTLSRILSQPIYRDALLFGKFLGALVTLAIALIVLWLSVIGLGLLFIGIPPGGEEVARIFVFLLVTIVYAGVWLALALLLSILFRSATAALTCLGLWLFLYVIWPMLAGQIAQIIVPPDPRYTALGLQTPGTAVLEQILSRLSPSTLFGEVVVALLDPTTRSLGPIYLSQMQGAVLGAPLPIAESMLIAWPQTVGMVATAILLFVIGYVIFQRQEVRA